MQPEVHHEPSVRFGSFELKLRSEELVRDGIPVKLPRQPFKILAMLAQNAGRLVTREELQKKIWGDDTFVDFDKGLNFCIKQIREALGDDAQAPQYVETLPRRGYRFIPALDECDQVVSLTPEKVKLSLVEPLNLDDKTDIEGSAEASPVSASRFSAIRTFKPGILIIVILVLLALPIYSLRGRFLSRPSMLPVGAPVVSKPQDASKTVTQKTVSVQKIPASWVLVRDVNGSYQTHPEVFQEVMKYVGSNFRAVGDAFGIYPMDPDAAKPGTLRWQVGVRIAPGKPLGYGNKLPLITSVAKSSQELDRERAHLSRPNPPYRIVLLEETEAAVVESSVEDTPKDGLSMFGWMAENGYVQVGATRMEYLTNEGSNSISTKIIIPIRKRPSGISVPKER
ncbi:MAG TPA: winged helix-turn-helix domain-containing protein [Pyrinomonadaceae bacterium]|nr:winged helix-turn-helix domain-containing protein [Pyrinomonadaceae bacterium]